MNDMEITAIVPRVRKTTVFMKERRKYYQLLTVYELKLWWILQTFLSFTPRRDILMRRLLGRLDENRKTFYELLLQSTSKYVTANADSSSVRGFERTGTGVGIYRGYERIVRLTKPFSMAIHSMQ